MPARRQAHRANGGRPGMTDTRGSSRSDTVEESTPELMRLAMHDAAKLLRAEASF